MADTSNAAPEPLTLAERLLAWAVYRAASYIDNPPTGHGYIASGARRYALTASQDWALPDERRRALGAAMECLVNYMLITRPEYWTEIVGGPAAESEPPLGVGA